MTSAADDAPTGAAPASPGRVRSRWIRPRTEVALLVALAAGVRLAAWQFRPAVLPDAAHLIGVAEAVRAGGGEAVRAASHHPLAPTLLSWVPAGADLETWGSVGACLLSALAVAPLHVLARTVGGRHGATVACLLYAVLPRFVSACSTPMAEAVFLPLFAAAFATAFVAHGARTPRRRLARAVVAGGLAGLAYFARPEGLVAGIAVAVAVGWRARRREGWPTGAAAALGFLLLAAPWIASMSADRGRFTISPKKDAGQFVGAAAAARNVPEEPTLPRGLRGLAETLWSALGPATALVFAGAFAGRRWRSRRTARARTVLLVAAAVYCLLVLRLELGWGYSSGRHAFAAAVLLLPFAGEGLVWLVGFFPRAVHRRRSALLLAMALSVPLAVYAVLRPDGESGERERVLGEAIAAAEPAGAAGDLVVVSFRQPLVAYYADRELRAAGAGRRARNVHLGKPLVEPFRDLLVPGADRPGLRGHLVELLRREGASWLVLEMGVRSSDAGAPPPPQDELARALLEEGVLGTPVLAAGELVAYPVRR